MLRRQVAEHLRNGIDRRSRRGERRRGARMRARTISPIARARAGPVRSASRERGGRPRDPAHRAHRRPFRRGRPRRRDPRRVRRPARRPLRDRRSLGDPPRPPTGPGPARIAVRATRGRPRRPVRAGTTRVRNARRRGPPDGPAHMTAGGAFPSAPRRIAPPRAAFASRCDRPRHIGATSIGRRLPREPDDPRGRRPVRRVPAA